MLSAKTFMGVSILFYCWFVVLLKVIIANFSILSDCVSKQSAFLAIRSFFSVFIRRNAVRWDN